MTNENPLATYLYVAVRRSKADNTEWIDITTAQIFEELARKRAEEKNKELPKWAADNPISRIIRMRVEEVSE